MQKELPQPSEPSKSQQAKTRGSAVRPDLTAVDARTDFLLDVAAKSFLKKGFEATSVGEIAQQAHASKETFYSKFTNKNELFRAVINRLLERFASDIGSALATHQEPRKVLSAFSGLLLESMLSDEGVGLQNIVFMEARRFPEVASVFYELGPKRTLNALAGYFDLLVRKGALRKVDAKLAASHFIGLLTSDLMMLRSLGLLETPTAEEKSKRSREAVEAFLRAYGANR